MRNSLQNRNEAHQQEWKEQLGFLQNSVGAIQGPFDSFLVLRGIKTLALRLERHCASALQLAEWLEREPKVRKVFYPGLKSHPQHALAQRQMNGFGGIISIQLDTDLAGHAASWSVARYSRSPKAWAASKA